MFSVVPLLSAKACLVGYAAMNLVLMISMSLFRVSKNPPKDSTVSDAPTRWHRAQQLTAEYSGVLCALFGTIHCSLGPRASEQLRLAMTLLVASRAVFAVGMINTRDHRKFNLIKFSGATGTYLSLAATIALAANEL